LDSGDRTNFKTARDLIEYAAKSGLDIEKPIDEPRPPRWRPRSGHAITISTLPDRQADSDQQEYHRYLLCCAAIIALALALKLPSLFSPRVEDDELIYWQLTQNWLDHGSYSLQGAPVLKALPPSIYDKPLFHHPPLLPIFLSPFVATHSPNAAILVSWLGHVLAIVGVAIICWTWRRRSWRATDLALWLPVLAMACDPLMTFTARKLWPDNLVGGFAGLAMGLYCLAAARRSAGWAVAGGVAAGLAGLAKLPGLFILPAGILVLVLWPSRGSSPAGAEVPRGEGFLGRTRSLARTRLGLACLGILPAFVILLPWFAVFYAQYHMLLPAWIRPDAALRMLSPLVNRAMDRPWHFYFSQSAMISPVVVVIFAALLSRFRLVLSVRLAVPLCWVGGVVLALMFLYFRGHSMQMRFLTPAIPGLYALLSGLLASVNPRRSFLGLAALLAVIYGVSTMGFFLYPENMKYDDIVSVPEIVWRMWTGQH